MVKVGIIGFGYWGPNLVRNFFELPTCKVKTIVDLKQERLIAAKKLYPAIKVTSDFNKVLNDQDIDAIIVATPVSTHFNLGEKVLRAGKHLLLEKPMTTSLAEATRLVELSLFKKKVLMIDHTFLYKDAIRKIKALIDEKEIGKLWYFDSTRTNLGLFQRDMNVLWDLAVHDISILLYLVKEKPMTIQASGVSHTNNKIENIAYVTMKYQSGFVAHFNLSWSSPVTPLKRI